MNVATPGIPMAALPVSIPSISLKAVEPWKKRGAGLRAPVVMPEDRYVTRETLLFRLRDAGDERAWSEFVAVYAPVLFTYCRKRGLSFEDSADLTQEVVRSVVRAMPDFVYDAARGSFRGWLFTILRRSISRHFKRSARDPLVAVVANEGGIEDLAGETSPDSWEIDYRRRLLAWAMERAKVRFNERIWRAFEESTLRERPADEVAAELGMTRNALTVAKCRVIAAIREIATRHERDWERTLPFHDGGKS